MHIRQNVVCIVIMVIILATCCNARSNNLNLQKARALNTRQRLSDILSKREPEQDCGYTNDPCIDASDCCSDYFCNEKYWAHGLYGGCEPKSKYNSLGLFSFLFIFLYRRSEMCLCY